jgi:hypothetical protein
VGIDISPSSCNVMGQRLEQVCGMRQAPPSMGVDEIAGSWDRRLGRAGLSARNPAGAASDGDEDAARDGRSPDGRSPDGRTPGKLFSETEDYVPIQVKNTDKVGRPEIDKFAHALRRDERRVGFFIGWEFSRDALADISRMGKLEEPQVIIPVPVQQLIAETFDTELLALAGR